ncbi:hypothetical protein KP509_04G060900 [Ceratopteris richardii]|uniref:Uncharacterized protein n=1 Tax=Ceratopteris richardii TaxID=49495 RepID=A0A8T2UZS3_CERRI|nr:hypothetical protein KP509_04G060900 [Ceratopteris richardii]
MQTPLFLATRDVAACTFPSSVTLFQDGQMNADRILESYGNPTLQFATCQFVCLLPANLDAQRPDWNTPIAELCLYLCRDELASSTKFENRVTFATFQKFMDKLQAFTCLARMCTTNNIGNLNERMFTYIFSRFYVPKLEEQHKFDFVNQVSHGYGSILTISFKLTALQMHAISDMSPSKKSSTSSSTVIQPVSASQGFLLLFIPHIFQEQPSIEKGPRYAPFDRGIHLCSIPPLGGGVIGKCPRMRNASSKFQQKVKEGNFTNAVSVFQLKMETLVQKTNYSQAKDSSSQCRYMSRCKYNEGTYTCTKTNQKSKILCRTSSCSRFRLFSVSHLHNVFVTQL